MTNPNPQPSKDTEIPISFCESCHCMTHTLVDHRCGKCKALKPSEDINYREYGEVRKYKLVDGIFLEAQIIVPGRLRWFGDMHKTMKAAKAELEAKLASLDNHIVPSEDTDICLECGKVHAPVANPQPSEAHRNHIVPNDNTDGAMTSAKLSKPSEATEFKEQLSNMFPGEDTATVREKVKVSLMLVATAGSDPKRREAVRYKTDEILSLIADHDRNLLAGIAPMQTEWEEDINGTPNPAGIIRNELRRAIIKAATPGKEME